MNRQEYETTVKAFLNALPSANKSKHTITAYDLALRKFAEHLNSTGVDEITRGTVVSFRSELNNDGVKANTIRHYMVLIHKFFVWAVKMGYSTENPVDTDEIPSQQTIEYNMLTLDEINRLLTERPNKRNKNYCKIYAMVVLFIQVGLRNSEMRALTVDDLDFENKTITIRHGKGDKKRVVPFPTLSREVISEYLNSGIRPATANSNEVLFGIENNGSWHEINIVNLNSLVKRYVKRVIGKDIHAHLLRHCACSLWASMDVPMRDVQQALGHASIVTTEKTYTHVLNINKSASAINEAFDDFLNRTRNS